MQKTMAQQKVASMVASAQKSDSLHAALLVFLGALFLISSFPFYPVYVTVAISALCGAIAYRKPPIGVLAGAIIAFFAVIYQTPVFGWIYVLVLALIMFEVFDHWKIIAFLEILILAPFAFSTLPYVGWATIAVMAIGALHFGSRKSVLISVPSVFMILLLSSIWLTQNSAYMPLNLSLYKPGFEQLQVTKAPVAVMSIIPETAKSIGTFVSPANLNFIWQSLSWIFNNSVILILQDSMIIQLIGWAAALYLIGYLPSRIKKMPQTLASFSLLIVVGAYFLNSALYKSPVYFEFIGAIAFAIALLAVFEHIGWNISRESEIQRSDRMKSYGKFGMSDISLGGKEKSMDDVGGYDDVKQELRDAIMLPLEKKEIAYTYGIKPPAGILLFGPPGTGKTMLMRALAKELKYNFIEVKCSQVLSQWYGESEKNIAEVFDNARGNAPTVLFFDEIEAIAKRRDKDSLDEVGPRVLSEMLQQIDGANKAKGTVMVVGATNLPNELDSALLRPGRLDKIIYMHLPDKKARKAIFEVHLKGLPLKDIDMDLLVKKTERFSGADVKNIVVEAKGLAAKEASESGKIIPISMEHMLRILDNVKPSTGIAQLEMYDKFRLDYERRVGEKKPEAKKKEVRWEDVAGLDQVKEALLEAIHLPLLHEKEMEEFEVKPSKGILLFGPPGTGKTLIVKAAASELKASFQSLSAADVMKKGYGSAVTVIKETFNRARENTPSIIFVDEIETFAPARGVSASSEIIGQFLTEMDGIKGMQGVVVIAATNRPRLMDPAIMRPGRFDKIFYIPPPDKEGRKAIFAIHLGKFALNIDLDLLAAMTSNFSGADIASICQSAKMKSLRKKILGKESPITTDVLEKITMERKPSITKQLISEYEKFLEEYGERR